MFSQYFFSLKLNPTSVLLLSYLLTPSMLYNPCTQLFHMWSWAFLLWIYETAFHVTAYIHTTNININTNDNTNSNMNTGKH